jgi:hypothetical protein
MRLAVVSWGCDKSLCQSMFISIGALRIIAMRACGLGADFMEKAE